MGLAEERIQLMLTQWPDVAQPRITYHAPTKTFMDVDGDTVCGNFPAELAFASGFQWLASGRHGYPILQVRLWRQHRVEIVWVGPDSSLCGVAFDSACDLWSLHAAICWAVKQFGEPRVGFSDDLKRLPPYKGSGGGAGGGSPGSASEKAGGTGQ